MAEPIILSYARGLLKEFPGVPEGVVDVIPVDLVVAAIVAAAGRPPDDEPTRSRATPHHPGRDRHANPLKYQRLVDRVRELVHRAPALRPRRPADRRAGLDASRARPASRASSTGPSTCCEPAEKVVVEPARSGAAGRRVGRARSRSDATQAERALTYVELYGAYTECEAVYGVDHLLDLWDSLDADDRAEFAIDPGVDRLGPLRHRDPPAVGGRARPGRSPPSRSSQADPHRPAARHRSCRPNASWPPSTSRTRSSRPTW